MSYCENIKCDFCQKLFKNEELFMIEGKHLCQDCYNSNVVECEFCESDILIGNSHYFDVYSEQGDILFSIYLCENCFEERTSNRLVWSSNLNVYIWDK